MALPEITVDDIRGVISIMPTPAKPGADRWVAEDTVDLEESARLTEAFVSSGANAIMTTGTFGECATLTWSEQQAFVDTVVSVVRGRVPVFAGATTLNTRDTIRRARELSALGADGLFLGRPMWVGLDDHGTLQYYRDVVEALPHVALIIYDNPYAFKGKISHQVYAELAKMPQVVASKHIGLALGHCFFEDLKAVEGKIRLLSLELDWYYTAKLFPDEVTGCWSGFYGCGPAPLIAMREAIFARDWERAQGIQEELDWASETFFPGGDIQKFFPYSIPIDKARFEAAGFFKPGPARPPYTYAPAAYLEGGAECGRRWKTLQEKYANQLTETVV
jgi:4-(2-carboxyphenyl)-2-oxobut-3-enoate aldolase